MSLASMAVRAAISCFRFTGPKTDEASCILTSLSNFRLDSASSEIAINDGSDGQIDLIGGPFAVIESDPGVFTSLTRKLGVKHLEIVELYDIEPRAVDHLHPTHRPADSDFKDPAAEHVWFENQISDDACASQAILNILFNCSNVDIGRELSEFKEYTREMSPKMQGISNSSMIPNAHDCLGTRSPTSEAPTTP
ncbi:cysteine proteinase [Armillaria gallica]|uniref:ubiquitinyl hydrolase 1 n=1 Tax=Armillaria gallica TaxID=47427 RepID=A0A2H3EBA3_ARMGA|nr:cysteine proteinase [Armillaria gallica]